MRALLNRFTHEPASLAPFASLCNRPVESIQPLSSMLPGRAEAGGRLSERESSGAAAADELGKRRGKGRMRKDRGGREREVVFSHICFASIPAWLLREPLICCKVSFTPSLFLPHTLCLYNFLSSLCFRGGLSFFSRE